LFNQNTRIQSVLNRIWTVYLQEFPKKKVMNNKYLFQLAQQILISSEKGLSKVRFAKIIYFVQKGLVQSDVSQKDALGFIRMPLGPVPFGFQEMTNLPNIAVKIEPNSLTYNAEVYSVKNKNEVATDNMETIDALFRRLQSFRTSDLVEYGHKEPSWLHNKNGTHYFLADDDLSIDLPTKSKSNDVDEKQLLQAQLLNGMLTDIVDESTALEYPTEK